MGRVGKRVELGTSKGYSSDVPVVKKGKKVMGLEDEINSSS
jgi:hypothetical protein